MNKTISSEQRLSGYIKVASSGLGKETASNGNFQEWITLGWKWNLMRGGNSPKTVQMTARVHALAANQRITQSNLYQTSVLLFCIPQQFLIQFPKHCLSRGYFSKIKS